MVRSVLANFPARGRPTVARLRKYARELNDLERIWRDLQAQRPAHSTYDDSDALDRAIQNAVEETNRKRKLVPFEDQPILT